MTLKKTKDIRLIPYTDAYRDTCFLIWYRNGRPRGNNLMGIFPPDDLGRVPPMEHFWKWIKEYGWNERADVLDAEVAKRIELQAVEERVEMLERQAQYGKTLQEKGMAVLEESGFQKSADALRAIFGGADLERASRGLSTALIKVSEMDDATLQDTLKKLMSKASETELAELIDGEVTEIKEEKDATEEPSSTQPE